MRQFERRYGFIHHAVSGLAGIFVGCDMPVIILRMPEEEISTTLIGIVLRSSLSQYWPPEPNFADVVAIVAHNRAKTPFVSTFFRLSH